MTIIQADEFDNPGVNLSSWAKADNYMIKSSSKYSNSDESGDELRLLEYLGEDPIEYREILGANRIGQLNSLARTVDALYNRKWSWADLLGKTKSQITTEKKNRAENAVKQYKEKFRDKAFTVLNNDMQAFKEMIDNSRNPKFQDQLKFLLESANLAKAELLKKQIDEVYKDFKLSLTGESIENALGRAEAVLRSAKDNDSAQLYSEIVNKLKEIKQEVAILKRNKDSITDALIAANNIASSKNSSPVQVELYTEVIKALEKEEKAELTASETIIKINKRVDSFIDNYGDSPSNALEAAKSKLVDLKNELKQLSNQRISSDHSTYKDKKAEIEIEEAVIEILKDKVKIAKDEDIVVQKRIEDLITKNHGDVEKALKSIQDRLKLSRVKNPIDVKIEKYLEDLLEDEKKLQEKLDAQDATTKGIVKAKFDAVKDNPVAIIKTIQMELDLAYVQLAALKEMRSPNKRDIKEVEDQINQDKASIEQLKKEVKLFEPKVTKRLNDVVKQNKNDDKKALESLLPASTGSTTIWNWLTGSKGASIDKSLEKITNPVDREVAVRLAARLKEAQDNDPVNIALARLNSASVLDIPSATEGVIAARLGQLGISMDNLDVKTRAQLAGHVSNTSRRLIVIMNSPLTTEQKQSEKRTAMQLMITEIGYLLAAHVSGVDADALATGDLATIATSKLINTIVGPTSSLVPMNYNFNDVDPQEEAYQTLGLYPGASQLEIRSAYIQLAKDNHPDMGGDKAKFQKINEAYALLRA